MTKQSVVEASCWSEVPALISNYTSLIDQAKGITRFFAYASLIDRHTLVKPRFSRCLPNEQARLKDMQVSMNLRTEKLFAGLEPAEGEAAYGVNITVLAQDRDEGITEYIRRELGVTPWGMSIEDILHPKNPLLRISGEADTIKKYRLRIVDVEIPNFHGLETVKALAVVTNEDLPTSLVGAEPRDLAKLLSEDRQSLDYFYRDALNPARMCNFHQKKLEAIAALLT